ncbi:hypothetical protein [Gordonia neofelifaecis]|uniref:Uncharacterized protein n=1 Tax=Gordonia neofelifaecis NRRL B-59395 TaxID=644548 RepID=F1YKT7_9ACTN|nr:hypothetical protein [Gordonia neofelifaecis]EGD54731.1 hypothetical protein SCNU_12612 [Gordonia neofelifaecis NRRL B-59395]
MDFGITPEQLNSIVARWRHCSDEIAGLDCEVGDLAVRGGLSTAALAACATAVRAITDSTARRLDESAGAIERFNTATVESDRACAAALAALRRSA